MKKLGSSDDDMPKSAYQEWPIFKQIREEKEFKKVFKEIFGEEYNFLNSDEDNIQKLIKEYMNPKENSSEKKESNDKTNNNDKKE